MYSALGTVDVDMKSAVGTSDGGLVGELNRPAAESYHVHAKLLDGTLVRIRAIRREDKEGLLAGFKRLSRDSVYLRFFQCKKELGGKELTYFTEPDFVHHIALVATIPENDDGMIIGVARYIAQEDVEIPMSAEIALIVADEYQGNGLGTLLFKHLVQVARANSISRFEADLLAENRHMLHILRRSGFPLTLSADCGVTEARFPITQKEGFCPLVRRESDQTQDSARDQKSA